MFTLRLQLCLLLLQFLSHVHGQLSDLRRCADPQCQKVIAEARTTMKYISGHRGVLSFPNNAVAKIYSKDAGSNLDWWGVEINGKRAYAPKKFLREDRVLVPDKLLQHVVPVEESSLISSNAKNKNANNDKIDKVKLNENLIDDEEEEADGGEEFLDEDDEEDEEPEGIQVYNAGANSPSNPEQEKSALTEEIATSQPSQAEAKPEEPSAASKEISSSSAKDPSTNVSPSTVDFEVVDGTTIFGDPVDTTPTPPYLPDYETPPPLYASTTNTVQTTTATPPLSPSVHSVPTVPEVGSDGSTTPELQVVPSGLPLSSLASREAPVSATPAPVLDEGVAASVAHVDSSVSNSVETSSSVTVNSETAPSSDVLNPEAVSVSEEGAGITRTKSEVADDNQENSGKNDIHNVNNSDLKLNSDTPAFEVDEAGNAAAAFEESNLPSTGDGGPAGERNFVPLSPILKVDSPPAELDADHMVEEVLNDGDSIVKSNGIHDHAGDGGTSEHASIALQSDDPVSGAEGTNPELEENSSDVPEDDGGSIFDSWLSGWSSAEDDSGTDVEASEEPSKESSSQSQLGEESEVGNVASSGNGAVDDLTNSVGEVSFISAADRVTASEQSTSFETTTEGVAATVTEGAALDGPEVVQENADPSGDTSGPAQVEGDGASIEAPDILTSESAGDASDLHDPESLTGHLLKTVEPIILFLTGSSQLGESLSLALEHDLSSPVASSGAVAAVVILALTILLLYVASALITKCSREGPLLKALNVLEHEQHTAEQLIADLQRKLAAGHLQTGSLAESSEAAQVMAQQLQQAQEENVALAERVQDLEQQLEESTSSGLEMDNMLQELLLSQKDTTSFQEAIDSLQQMLDSQREKVESLTADLSIKTTLNEELRGESATAKERIRKLEYQLDQVTQSLEEVNSAKAQVVAQLAAEQGRLQHVTEERDVLARSSSDASAALAALTEQHSGVQAKAQQLRSTLKTKEAELQVTKECLKQLKVFNNDGKAAKEKLAQLLDSVKARSELACAVEERRTLEADLQQRSETVAQLERRVQQAQEEAEQCRKDQATADQEKREALSKLAVLTDYFHEKEAQLTKELESESGLRLDAEGSAESITSRMRDYDMQLLAYKTQVNTLKKELEDQELSFKTQLAAQEQKAHESWVSARAAERKYEESKQETAQMRSRLLLMSKDNSDQHAIIKPTPQHAETSNGSVSSPRPPLHDDLDGEHSHPLDSPPPIPPPHMLPHLFPPPPNLPPGMPPPFPPPHFLPPPLPPPMMADRRLPPAGRLASPPFHRRMGAASPPEFLDRRSPPHFDRRSYSPASSRYSDRQGRYSPDRHGRYSPDRHGRYSPDRHGRYSPDRQGRFSPGRYSPDRLSDRMYDRHHHHHNDRYNNIDRHSDAYSSNGRNDSQRESSPERPYNRSPEGFARKASPPPLHRRLYDEGGGPPTRKGKKTSTPVGPNDR